MTRTLPPDRLPIRRRALSPVVAGTVGSLMGLAVVFRTGVVLDEGWVGAVPEPLQAAAGVVAVLAGLAFGLPSLVWMLWPLNRPQVPVVHFESDHLAIRGSLIPRTFVVSRESVALVYIYHVANVGHGFGLWPMVVIRTADGKGKGVQYLYEGDPDDLARDLARWASVPVGRPRKGLLVHEEISAEPPFGPTDTSPGA